MKQNDCLQTEHPIRNLQLRFAHQGDMKAYNGLYLHFYDGLHRFSFSMTKSREGAEEVVSDVFIKLWQIRAQLDAVDNLKVYLYTITRNLSLNYIARASRHPVDPMEGMHLEPDCGAGNPEELYIAAETISRIKAVIHELPPQCRLIFQLVKEEGLKYKEVAAILEISVFTVRNQVAIAVRKIAEALPAHLQKTAPFHHRFAAS